LQRLFRKYVSTSGYWNRLSNKHRRLSVTSGHDQDVDVLTTAQPVPPVDDSMDWRWWSNGSSAWSCSNN